MFFLKLLLIFIFFVFTSSLKASTLDEVKNRGYLICGVSEPRNGFANIDDNKNWFGGLVIETIKDCLKKLINLKQI